jgi:hypothetical protein
VDSRYWLANNLMRLLRLDGAPPDGLVGLSSPLPIVWAVDGMGFFVCSCGGDLLPELLALLQRDSTCLAALVGSVRAGSCGRSGSSCSRACLVSSQCLFTYSGSSRAVPHLAYPLFYVLLLLVVTNNLLRACSTARYRTPFLNNSK